MQLLRYLKFLRSSLVPLFVMSASSLLMAMMIIFVPAMQKLLFDKLFVTMDVWLLLKFMGLSLILLLFDILLHTIYTLYSADVESRVSNRIKRYLMKLIMHCKYPFITNNGTGFLIKRIVEDAPIISRGIIHLIHAANALLLIVSVGVVVHFISQWLVSIYLLLIVISIVCTLLLTIPSALLNGKVGNDYSDLSDLCYGILPGVREIKTNSLVKVLIGKMKGIHEQMKRRFLIYSVFCTLQWQVASIVPRIGYVLLLIHGLASVERGDISIGTFYGLIVMMWIMFDPLEKLFFHYSFFHGALMAAKRVDTIQQAPQECSGVKSFDSFTDEISIRDLSFSYDNNEVLDKVSITIPKGSDIAIVGESGCGKSTLVQLLVGIFDSYSGAIELDGHTLEKWSLSSIRDKILYIPATAPLFPLSVRDNVDVHGVKDEHELHSVFEQVNLTTLLNSLPEGMHTTYREEVGDFSGGEKQRIALARSLAKKAEILILDEATSALDEENERLILDRIKEAYTDKTIIRVSHKMSAIRGCDRVFVLQDGTIVEQGSIDELEQQRGAFCRLFNLGA